MRNGRFYWKGDLSRSFACLDSQPRWSQEAVMGMNYDFLLQSVMGLSIPHLTLITPQSLRDALNYKFTMQSHAEEP